MRAVALAILGPIHQLTPDGSTTLCGLPRAMFGRELDAADADRRKECRTCARVERQVARWHHAVKETT